jgi:hypothetical protein
MANEAYVAAQGDLLATNILAQTLEMLLHQRPCMRRLCAFRGDTRGSGSATIKVPQLDDDDIGEAVAEGAGPTNNTAITDGSYSLTPARQAIKRVLSHRLEGIDALGVLNEIAIAQYNFNGVMRAFDGLVAAQVTNLTGTVGTSGQPFTADDWFDAQQALMERLVTGKRAALLDPFQFSNLQDDLRGEVGPWQLNLEVQAAVSQSNGENFKGTLNGIEIWTSTQVADANGGVDHDGCMIKIPDDSTIDDETGKFMGDSAFGFAEGSPNPVTLVPGSKVMAPGGVVYSMFDASANLAEVLITTNYFAAVGVAEAARGIKIRTLHAA